MANDSPFQAAFAPPECERAHFVYEHAFAAILTVSSLEVISLLATRHRVTMDSDAEEGSPKWLPKATPAPPDVAAPPAAARLRPARARPRAPAARPRRANGPPPHAAPPR